VASAISSLLASLNLARSLSTSVPVRASMRFWRPVSPNGKVIGIDMIPDMVAKAFQNVSQLSVTNVELLLGEIGHCRLEIPRSIW
jgi:precorrin-6B methylase 2